MGSSRKYDTIVPQDEAKRHTDLANDLSTEQKQIGEVLMKVDDKMYETDNSDNGLAIVP